MSDSPTDQTAEAELIHPVVKRSSEFSDRLSPMLVKELRQGLKGYGFMLLFISVQAALTLFILGAAFADSYDNTGQEISQVVFYLLSMAVLIAQPLRGMSAISSEIKENTIELMVMTRLSAWRIAFGKWISIVSQTALIVAAVAPYLILRYFFGGMQLFPEIMMLISLFILSACLTAITVGLSAITSFIIRGFVGASIAIIIFSFSNSIFDSRGNFYELLELFSFGSAQTTVAYFSLMIGAIYFGWLALDFGASYIAPAAENRSTPRKLIALSLIGIIVVILAFAPSNTSTGIPAVMTIFAAPVIAISLTELSFMVPPTSASFLRRGIFARLSRYALYPGWQSGIWFFLLLYALTMLSICFVKPHQQLEMFAILTIIFSGLIFPLTITKLFFRNKANLFTYYIAIVLASTLLFLVTLFVIKITSTEGLAMFFCWLPPMQFYLYLEAHTDFGASSYGTTSELVLAIIIGSLALNWFICFFRSIPKWKFISKNEEQAKAMLESIASDNSPSNK